MPVSNLTFLSHFERTMQNIGDYKSESPVKTHLVNFPSIQESSHLSPTHNKKLPLLAKRNPDFKLGKLQISPRNELLYGTGGFKKMSPKR
jgi:hypothetical protein